MQINMCVCAYVECRQNYLTSTSCKFSNYTTKKTHLLLAQTLCVPLGARKKVAALGAEELELKPGLRVGCAIAYQKNNKHKSMVISGNIPTKYSQTYGTNVPPSVGS